MIVTPWAASQALLDDHTDLTFIFSPAEGSWSAEYRHGGSEENPNQATPFDLASLPARDQSYPNDGERLGRPSGEIWDFIGVDAGSPIWYLPDVEPPGRNFTWPGFRTVMPNNTFRAYVPSDPRFSGTTPFRWLKIELNNVTYSGSSANPQLSAWKFESGSPVVWMATSDGIDASDVYYLTENAHRHINWAFSALGIYRATFTASGIEDSSGLTVESAQHTVTFAVGTMSTWLATHYAGPDLVSSSVTGYSSDSDADGNPLLLEYAFNLDPTVSDRQSLIPGTGIASSPVMTLVQNGEDEFLQLEFIRRKSGTNPQITYIPEINDSLDPLTWTTMTGEQVTSIDQTWERVIVTDPVSVESESRRFGRVRVEVQSSIPY